jgi:hypothetical protein
MIMENEKQMIIKELLHLTNRLSRLTILLNGMKEENSEYFKEFYYEVKNLIDVLDRKECGLMILLVAMKEKDNPEMKKCYDEVKNIIDRIYHYELTR